MKNYRIGFLKTKTISEKYKRISHYIAKNEHCVRSQQASVNWTCGCSSSHMIKYKFLIDRCRIPHITSRGAKRVFLTAAYKNKET